MSLKPKYRSRLIRWRCTAPDVVAAISSGEIDPDAAELHVITRLTPESAPEIRKQLSGMDAEARFALLDTLRQLLEDLPRYDFSAVFGAMTSDDDASVRTIAVTGLGFCETSARRLKR